MNPRYSYQELQKKLPKKSCEAEKAAYFSIEVTDTKSLKEAKKRWVELFTCVKTIEAQLVYATRSRTSQL